MRQLSVNDFYAWGLFLITTYCCIWWFPSAHITRAVHSFVLKDYIILGIALHLIWSSTGSIAGQVSGDWMGRVQTGLLYYSMSCCFQLTHEDGYLLSKAASWAFYSLGLSCFPVMYAKEHEALSWVSSGANSRTSRAEVLPTQDLFSWAGSESGLERSWEGGNPGTSIWIHTAILWLESRYKQCCCCCKVKVWITVLHSVWQNKRGEYQRGDHCTICYLKGPLHLFYTWTYHSLCLWGNLTCINCICKKKKKGTLLSCL